MINKRNISIFMFMALLAVLIVSFGGWIAYKTDTQKPDYYFEIDKNMSIFGKVYEEITNRYVEVIEPEKFMKAGIYGMLETLDPYTVFIEKEENDELQIITHGKYGGVGMRISKRGDYPSVVDPPFDGTPSAKAGIREGDQIIEIDGISTKDLSVSETANKLRGKPGTEVFIKIQRVGELNVLEFRLIREEIKVEEITYSGIIQDDIGYIRLAHFSRDVGQQVSDAIVDLKDQGMNKLVLDLRGNPGGLLESAISVADNFLPRGMSIVSTKGKAAGTNQDYRSEHDPIWGTEPLVVLVDTISASASEIVAGAIQDLDRGVIIGSPTFGKGLVQTVIPISKETALKITTAKYYIPSGRLIQKPDIYEDPDILLSTNYPVDSTMSFLTLHGRTVTGSGGITPDIRLKPKLLPLVARHLIMQSMFFNFSLEYAAKHPDLDPSFSIDEEIITEFKSFLREKEFSYKTPEEVRLDEIKKIIDEHGYAAESSESILELEKVIAKQKEKDFEDNIDVIKMYLKSEIIGKLWGTAAKVKLSLEKSDEVKEAIAILSDIDKYNKILNNNIKN